MLTEILLVTLVSGMAAQECNLNQVQRGWDNSVAFNATNQVIQFTTEASLGSNKDVIISPRSDVGNWGTPKGDIWLRFGNTKMLYSIGGCNAWEPLPVPPPITDDTTWTIAITLAPEKRFKITCNNVEVLNVVLDDTLCPDTRWRDENWWSGTPTKIFFDDRDTASEQYCITVATDINWTEVDRTISYETPTDPALLEIEVKTQTIITTDNWVSIEFLDQAGMPFGFTSISPTRVEVADNCENEAVVQHGGSSSPGIFRIKKTLEYLEVWFNDVQVTKYIFVDDCSLTQEAYGIKFGVTFESGYEDGASAQFRFLDD